MKLRALALIALITGLLFVAGSPASAQRPIPGIKQTVAFKQLKNYVQFLGGRKNVPASSTQKMNFRSNLNARKRKANQKVVALYKQKLTRLSKQDDNQERRQVKQIRLAQKRQVQALKQDLADRINDIQEDQAQAVQRVYDNFAPRINMRADRRDALKRQLKRTKNPAKRAALIRQINKLQTQINALVSDRTIAVNNVNSKFSARISKANNLYNSRIAGVRANAQRQIQQARTAWRQTFRPQIAAAKPRRDGQKEIVASVASRGAGYIDQMPPVNE